MNTISDTAFFTCSLRARDAVAPRVICGDNFAGVFIDPDTDDIFQKMNIPPRMTASISARHRIIDDLLRERLALQPELAVVILGCGFDTRAFRMAGGRWYEVDEPQIIEDKNTKLGTTACGNYLQRISIDFATEDLHARLPSIEPSIPVIVVMEGVLLYLEDSQIERTMAALRRAYPGHFLICDLITREMVNRHSRPIRAVFESVGATWKFMPNDPVSVIEQTGYQVKTSIPIVDRSLELQSVPKFVRWLLHRLQPNLNGMAVHVFQAR
jgi:methyltransferase (TIGR00027 family)